MNPKNAEIHEKIATWLLSNQNLKEGLKLHTQYSRNQQHKLRLATSNLNKKLLLVAYMQELAKIYKPVNVIEQIQSPKSFAAKKKVFHESFGVRFSRECPKIDFSNLPDKLKLLVFKRFDLNENAIRQHINMHLATNDESRFEAARACILSVQENWEIWDELNEYQITGKPLGKHVSFQKDEFEEFKRELELMDDVERGKEMSLIRRRAKNNINAIMRRKGSQDVIQMWIKKHDYVSEILGEALWQ